MNQLGQNADVDDSLIQLHEEKIMCHEQRVLRHILHTNTKAPS